MSYKFDTMEEVHAACAERNLTVTDACREMGRITGAKLNVGDFRSRANGRLANPMRAAFGMFFLTHDLIYNENKEPPV